MIIQKILGMSWQLWLVIIGMATISMLVSYSLFRFYKQYSQKLQPSQKTRLIIGLVIFALIPFSAWLFTVSLILSY